ncbi:MAG: winged helix-turn-helix transcriptional regulator [archaeon]
MKKYLIFLVLLLCLNIAINTVSAAKIYGTVYDTSLLPVDKAVVEINTQPKQTYVTQDGKYSFNVPIGNYVIQAETVINEDAYTDNQNLSIKDDGEYILDLILFPDIGENLDDLDFDLEPGIDTTPVKSYTWIWVIVIVILVLIMGFFIFTKNKKYVKKEKKEETKKIIDKEETKEENKEAKDKEEDKEATDKETIKDILDEDEELNKIHNMIKQAKRITQKDIRKQTGLSEAKISLVISQLESEGKIKKIKKGRTNVIIIQ